MKREKLQQMCNEWIYKIQRKRKLCLVEEYVKKGIKQKAYWYKRQRFDGILRYPIYNNPLRVKERGYLSKVDIQKQKAVL